MMKVFENLMLISLVVLLSSGAFAESITKIAERTTQPKKNGNIAILGSTKIKLYDKIPGVTPSEVKARNVALLREASHQLAKMANDVESCNPEGGPMGGLKDVRDELEHSGGGDRAVPTYNPPNDKDEFGAGQQPPPAPNESQIPAGEKEILNRVGGKRVNDGVIVTVTLGTIAQGESDSQRRKREKQETEDKLRR